MASSCTSKHDIGISPPCTIRQLNKLGFSQYSHSMFGISILYLRKVSELHTPPLDDQWNFSLLSKIFFFVAKAIKMSIPRQTCRCCLGTKAAGLRPKIRVLERDRPKNRVRVEMEVISNVIESLYSRNTYVC